ncbi:MAG: MBL fold metallo-hydrolase [Candidatus Omnitrophica bacterium]|nr:MBL fold metallo-hydrolase [Candidatus Omnitrophota bacterium]
MGRITVIFNNAGYGEGLKSAWGLSMLVEHKGNTVLFDTGGDAGILLGNMKKLGVKRKDIDKIAISHFHNDHIGGLLGLLECGEIAADVYLPAGVDINTEERIMSLSKSVVIAAGRSEVAGGVNLISVKSLFYREVVLAIDAQEGLLVITGCAHPGIYRILKHVRDAFGKDVYAVFGGFHFEHYPVLFVRIIGSFMKNMGLKLIGPSHCTGERSCEVLRRLFRENFVDLGLGKTFEYQC